MEKKVKLWMPVIFLMAKLVPSVTFVGETKLCNHLKGTLCDDATSLRFIVGVDRANCKAGSI